MAEKYERPWSSASDWSMCSDAWVTSHNPIGGDYERPKSSVSNWSIFSYAWVTCNDPVGGVLWEAMFLSLWLVNIFRCVSHEPRPHWWRIMRGHGRQPPTTTITQQPTTPGHPPQNQSGVKTPLWGFDFYTFWIFEWSMTSVLNFGRLFSRFAFFFQCIVPLSGRLPPLLDLVLSVMGGEEACLLLPTHQPTQGHSQAGPHCNENSIYVFLC
jgi:hypothetical protein